MKQVIFTLQGNEKKTQAGLKKAKELYKELSVDSDSKRLYLNKANDIRIPLFPDDYIIIHGGEKISVSELNNREESNPTVNRLIYIIFNGKRIDMGFKKAKMKAEEICLLDKELERALLFAGLNEFSDIFVQRDLTLVIQDNDSYFTIPFDEDNIADLEKCAKSDRKPPKGQKFYRIKIDGEKYKVNEWEITGERILNLAGKTYNEWSLNQKFCGGRRKPIDPTEVVDLTQNGIERFETVRKQAQQGVTPERFPLPAEDTEYLKANFPQSWEYLVEGSKKGILISQYLLPEGYSPQKADLMIMIPDNYPAANIDMFYFFPDVSRKDGTAIEALNGEIHFEKNWQRWSRHYKWRAGTDNIATHVSYIQNQLKAEFATKP